MHPPSTPPSDVPPLEAGDNLRREAFHRRYRASPHITKAELVEGVVYVASPVKHRHAELDSHLHGWLYLYCASTPGVRMAANATVVLDDLNEVQPDGLLRLPASACLETPDGFLAGPPELVIEVANTSAAYDLNQKREAYRRNGVREYVVLVLHERRVRYFDLVAERLVDRDEPEDGVYRSAVFPGLWLDAPALLAREPRVIETLRAGLASEEHAAFVRALPPSAPTL